MNRLVDTINMSTRQRTKILIAMLDADDVCQGNVEQGKWSTTTEGTTPFTVETYQCLVEIT